MVSAGEPAAALTPVVLLSSSGSAAFAASPCGANRDGNHACGVNSPSAQTGSLTTDNEQDYYVFSAQKNTELSVGLADGENPGCSADNSSTGCGTVCVELYDSSGDHLAEGTVFTTQQRHCRAWDVCAYARCRHLLPRCVGWPWSRRQWQSHRHPVRARRRCFPAVQWPSPVLSPPPLPPPPPSSPSQTVHDIKRCRIDHRRRHHHRVKVRVCRTVTVNG